MIVKIKKGKRVRRPAMLRIRSLLFLLFLICGLPSLGTCQIRIQIDAYPEKKVFLGYHRGPDVRMVDSAITDKNGRCRFEAETNLSKGVYFVVFPSEAYLQFLVGEDQEFTLHTQFYHLLDYARFTGSEINTQFINMQREIAKLNRQGMQLSIQKKYYRQYPDSLRQLEEKIGMLNARRQQIYDKYYTENTDNLLGTLTGSMVRQKLPAEVLALKGRRPKEYFDYVKYYFFDRVDFSEPALVNTPEYVFHQKLNQWLKYFVNTQVDNQEQIKADMDSLMKWTAANDTIQRYVISHLLSYYENPPTIGMDAAFVYLAKNYMLQDPPDWATEEMLEQVKHRVERMEYSLIGMQAKELRLPSLSGEMSSLYDMDAPFTILWFWDDDCAACAEKTPRLIHQLDSLKAMGIKVFSVYVGSNPKNWENKAQTGRAYWIAVRIQRGFSNTFYYGIHRTPRIYILDAEKKILAKDVEVAKLTEYIHYLQEKSSPELLKSLYYQKMRQ